MPCSEIAPCSGGLNQSKHPELGPTESPDHLRTELTFSSLLCRLCLIIIPSYIQPTLCGLLGLFTCINSFEVPDTLESTQGRHSYPSLALQKWGPVSSDNSPEVTYLITDNISMHIHALTAAHDGCTQTRLPVNPWHSTKKGTAQVRGHALRFLWRVSKHDL